MTRIIDFLVEILERIGRLFGIGRRPAADGDPYAQPSHGVVRRVLMVLPGLILVLMLLYLMVLFLRFCFYPGMDMSYPQRIIPDEASVLDRPDVSGASRVPSNGLPASNDPTSGGTTAKGAAPSEAASADDEKDASGDADNRTCASSRIVQMQVGLVDMMVNQNPWVPGDPQYRLGFFGLIDFADTPWFDNKAAMQIGMLTIVRRVSLDLADTLGRVRGTSQVDSDLQAAQSRLRTNERAWVLNNPFDPQLQTVMEGAEASYRGAIPLYESYNSRLDSCEALFDVRRDNLRTLLDRLAADLGSMASRLASRSKARQWSVEKHRFVPAQGNNLSYFDMLADNLFYEAKGELFALHGLMQAVHQDFAKTIESSDLSQVWDRMEAHIAEGAALSPAIVSNGRDDGTVSPDHLSVMAEKVLRARANMVELREILDR